MNLSLIKSIKFLRALQSRPFALLWIGQTISNIGDGAFFVALSWFVLQLTGSSTAIGFVVIAQTLPMLLFLPLGGVIADRLPRRLIMLWSDFGRALVVLTISILGFFHLIQVWHLLVLLIIFGIADAVFRPAFQAIPPQLVKVADLPSANALVGFSMQANLLIGPLFGSLLIAIWGTSAAFVFDGLTFVLSALFLLVMRLPASEAIQSPVIDNEGEMSLIESSSVPVGEADSQGFLQGLWKELCEGMTYAFHIKWFWTGILIASGGAAIMVGTWAVALPKLVGITYKEGAWFVGMLWTITSIGEIVGSIAVGHQDHLKRRGKLFYSALVISSLGLIAMGLPFSTSNAVVFISIAAGIVGIGLGFANTLWVTLLQEFIAEDMLGRVSSIDWLVSFCLNPVGLAVAGLIADHWSPAWVFMGGGFLYLALSIIGFSLKDMRVLS